MQLVYLAPVSDPNAKKQIGFEKFVFVLVLFGLFRKRMAQMAAWWPQMYLFAKVTEHGY